MCRALVASKVTKLVTSDSTINKDKMNFFQNPSGASLIFPNMAPCLTHHFGKQCNIQGAPNIPADSLPIPRHLQLLVFGLQAPYLGAWKIHKELVMM